MKRAIMPLIAGFAATLAAALLAAGLVFIAAVTSGSNLGSMATIIETIRMIALLGCLMASPVTLVLFPILAWAGRAEWAPGAGAIGGGIVLSLPLLLYMLADISSGVSASLFELRIVVLLLGPACGFASGHVFGRIVPGGRKSGTDAND